MQQLVRDEDANPLTCERTEMKVLNEGGSFEISNTGSIISNNYGIYSVASNNGLIITNNGKIIIENNQPLITHGMYIDSSGPAAVVINNNGLIDNSNSNGYALYLTGKVEVKNSGTLRGNIKIPDQYGSLGNSGTIELSEHSTATINHFNNEGKLIIALKTGTPTGTQYSKVMTNTAIFKNNSTIDVNVLDSSTNVALLAGSKLDRCCNCN